MLYKVTDNFKIDTSINEFYVCGDPGCDGYGSESIAVFQRILKKESDALFIVGDLVPIGEDFYFKDFLEMIDFNAVSPVFCAVGNHDINNYEKHLGKKDYFIKNGENLFIILDNSKRYFSDETLDFLKETLKENSSCSDIFVFFHIPPPNPFVENSFSEENWNKLKNILDLYSEKVRFLFCGHIHYGFDYKRDGYRIIITGGAGGRLDEIDNTTTKDIRYHTFKCKKIDGNWILSIENINLEEGDGGYTSEKTFNNLNSSILDESYASFNYWYYSEIAKENKLWGIERLLKALSLSENKHAESMLLANSQKKYLKRAIEDALENEKHEFTKKYPKLMNEAEKEKNSKGKTCYRNAKIAEHKHHALLEKALEKLKEEKDIELIDYYVCQSCGYLHPSDILLKRCPACGADKYKFVKV